MKFLRLAGAALVLMSAAIYVVGQKKNTVRPEEAGGQKISAPATATSAKTLNNEQVPTQYFYEFEQPEFVVRHITIDHDTTGRGEVVFERKNDAEAIKEPLQLSPNALQRITALWDALRFLETEKNYQSEKQFAHLGTTRLRMTRGEHNRTAEFNWTKDKDASALVNEYRRAADQALFVFEINLSRELQPLDSPKLLSRLDILLQRNGLSDPQQLIPLLRELSTDERLPLIARNHAGRLLKKLDK